MPTAGGWEAPIPTGLALALPATQTPHWAQRGGWARGPGAAVSTGSFSSVGPSWLSKAAMLSRAIPASPGPLLPDDFSSPGAPRAPLCSIIVPAGMEVFVRIFVIGFSHVRVGSVHVPSPCKRRTRQQGYQVDREPVANHREESRNGQSPTDSRFLLQVSAPSPSCGEDPCLTKGS